MNNTLNRAFPIVAAALGNKLGVQVVVGGRQAYTDGKVIHLPAYSLDEPSYKDVAWGYLAHEAGHVRFTDFDIGVQSATSPIRKDILNILEDVRIEAAMIALYPGTRQTLQSLDEYIVRSEGHYALATTEAHPAAILLQFLFLRLATDVLRFKGLADMAEKVETVLEAVFPVGAVTRLFGLLAEVPHLDSTRGALSLTDRILRMLEEERDKAAEQAQHQEPSEQNGQAQAGNSQASEDDGDTPEPVGDVDGLGGNGQADSDEEPCDQASGSTNGQEEAQDDGSQTSPGQAGDGRPSPEEVLSALLQAQEDDLPKDIAQIARELLSGQQQQSYDMTVTLPHAVTPETYPQGPVLVQAVLAESGKIRAALQSWVQADSRNHSVTKSHGRKINGKKLARLAVGDPRVFEHSSIRRKPDAAVHLLIDFSGSMDKKDGNKTLAEIAIESAIALALALEGIHGVNPAITRFPYKETENVMPLLRHGQKVRPNAAHFAASPDGASTPLHSALWYAASAVLATKQSKKAILVLTDGEPDNKQSALSIIERCKHSGIEMVGIGIGHDIGHLFDQAIQVDDVTQLRRELFCIGRQLLAA